MAKQGFDGKACIVCALIGGTENADELSREAFHQDKSNGPHAGFRNQKLGEQLFHLAAVLCAHVKAHDGNAPGGHPHHNGNDDLEELHDDAHYHHGNLGKGFLRENCIHRAVFAEHIVDGRHGSDQTDLGQEAGDAQYKGSAADFPGQPVILLSRFDDLHIAKIPNRQNSGCYLADDCGDSCTHHPPAEQEDKNGVQDDVDEGAKKRGDHGKFRVSIGADDGIHGLPEHIGEFPPKFCTGCDFVPARLCNAILPAEPASPRHHAPSPPSAESEGSGRYTPL